MQNGKGSKPRPISDMEQFLENWDEIFKKKVVDKSEQQCDTPKNYEKHPNSTRTSEGGLQS
jgi:hypothetical protein